MYLSSAILLLYMYDTHFPVFVILDMPAVLILFNIFNSKVQLFLLLLNNIIISCKKVIDVFR